MTDRASVNDAGGQRSRAVEKVLGRLKDVRRNRTGWTARCPAHEDRKRHLSIAVGDDGRVLLKCFVGCEVKAIIRALGLTMRDLFEKPSREGSGGGGHIPPRSDATVQPGDAGAGLTLAQYAEAKRLPLEFLRSLGITEIPYLGQPAVRFPYLDDHGSEVAVRFRLSLVGDERFRWRKGAKPCPYGRQRLSAARAAGRIVLGEGESDLQTLWLHDIPALTLPGADMWRQEYAGYLDGIAIIYVIVEPDKGGKATLNWLSRSAIRDRVRLVDLGEHKDPSGLYLDDPATFRERFQSALDAAVPWSDHEQAEGAERSAQAWALCAGLARQPDILARFADDLARSGVAGESRIAKLIYLVVTSRLLDKPVSLVVKGPSSGGKSYLVQRVLDHFPASAYHALSAMSERVLAYGEEPLSHRMLVIYEASGLHGDLATYLMRSLLSEGRVRYETVDKTVKGLRARLIEREGPTGLITTTTAVHLHTENETRLISVQVTDTPEQTRSVLLALAEDQPGEPRYAEWHALQEWLEGAERNVIIPYAGTLAREVPPVAVRLRRDFGAVLGLIRAHAILHQANRERASDGRVIATLDDYRAVRELIADLVAEGAGRSVSNTVRQTVEAVRRLLAAGASEVTATAVADELRLDKSTASRRVKAALADGYLKNLETTKGKPLRLVIGEALPEETEVLPRPEVLGGCTVAAQAGSNATPSCPDPSSDDWPLAWWEAYEERLAIAVIDGGLSQAEAQAVAADYVRSTYQHGIASTN